MKISIVTPTLGDRGPFLQRLQKQAPWIHEHEWIVCGPSELGSFLRAPARTVHIRTHTVIGTARNLCAEAATGDVIVHVDDDDWQHPDRLRRQLLPFQIRPVQGHPPELVGSSWLYCLNASNKTGSRISMWDTPSFLGGMSLAYTKAAWKSHPFPDTMTEDGPFTSHFVSKGTALDLCDPKLLVYMREHGQHTENQRDWWRETREKSRPRTAADVMKERIENPGRPLRFRQPVSSRNLAIEHEEEAATVYLRWLMGDDFEWFCRKP